MAYCKTEKMYLQGSFSGMKSIQITYTGDKLRSYDTLENMICVKVF